MDGTAAQAESTPPHQTQLMFGSASRGSAPDEGSCFVHFAQAPAPWRAEPMIMVVGRGPM